MLKSLLALSLPLGTMAADCGMFATSFNNCEGPAGSGGGAKKNNLNCKFTAGSNKNKWTKSCTFVSDIAPLAPKPAVAAAYVGDVDPCMKYTSSSSKCTAKASQGGEAKKNNLNCKFEAGSNKNGWKKRCTFDSYIVPLAPKPADVCSVGKSSNWACTNTLGPAKQNGLDCEFHQGHNTPSQGRNGETCTHWWCSPVCTCTNGDCAVSDAVKADAMTAMSAISVNDFALFQAASNQAALANQAKVDAASEDEALAVIADITAQAEAAAAAKAKSTSDDAEAKADIAAAAKAKAEIAADAEAKAEVDAAAAAKAKADFDEAAKEKRDTEWLLPSPISPTPVSPGAEPTFHLDMYTPQCNPRECENWTCVDWCHCFESNPLVEQMFNSLAYGSTLAGMCPSDATPCEC